MGPVRVVISMLRAKCPVCLTGEIQKADDTALTVLMGSPQVGVFPTPVDFQRRFCQDSSDQTDWIKDTVAESRLIELSRLNST